jgi:hypothetical protein
MEAEARTWYVNVMVALNAALQAAWPRDEVSVAGAIRRPIKFDDGRGVSTASANESPIGATGTPINATPVETPAP